MTITVTNKVKSDLMNGLVDFLNADKSGMRFDSMRIEDDDKIGVVRVVFSLAGKDLFFYEANGCRLSGGVINISGVEGVMPFSLSAN